MKRIIESFRPFAPLIALFLVGCNFAVGEGAESTSVELRLETYDIPAAHAAEIRSVVKNLLYRGKDIPPAGTVATTPTGQLLVAAPPTFHPGIKKYLKVLETEGPKPPPTVNINYWVVIGKKTDKTAGVDKQSETIRAALTELDKLHGPMEFRLLESLRVSSLSGFHGEARGAFVDISQNASAYGGKAIVDLEIEPKGPNRFRTRLHIPLDKTLVLGQSGFPQPKGRRDHPFSEEGSQPNMTVFYFVRARVDEK